MPLAGAQRGPSPVDRARQGSKHHVITDARGIPLAVSPTGGNRNDITQLLPPLDKIPSVAGTVGPPRHRPDALLADRGYDHDKSRRLLRARGIRPVIAERGQPHDPGLGIFRYVAERTIACRHDFRRLRIRWEQRDDIHEAFLGLATCLIPTDTYDAVVRTSKEDIQGQSPAGDPGSRHRRVVSAAP